MKSIPLLKPTYDEQTKKELLEVLDSGWVGFGPKTLEFEKKFAKYVGAKFAIATNSGTSALDLCLKVYDIKGGELITPAFTFVSDAIVGEWNNMEITFADIEEKSLCIDPDSIQFNSNTQAIIAVDSHGRLANVKRIKELIKEKYFGEYEPIVIEDAAHACYTPGAGKYADITVWSFQAVKTLPIFDGGMITTNNEEIYKKLRTLTWLGIEKSTYDRAVGQKYTWDYDITQSQGIKAYMTDVQAVIGIGQLRRLEKMNARRREIQAKYNLAFMHYNWFKMPTYSYTVQYYTPEWEDRDGLSKFLSDNGIHTSVHFKPISDFTYWKKYKKNPLPITDKIWKNLLSLPVHSALTNEEQDFIIEKVKEYYKC